jgi:hypothetical protein
MNNWPRDVMRHVEAGLSPTTVFIRRKNEKAAGVLTSSLRRPKRFMPHGSEPQTPQRTTRSSDRESALKLSKIKKLTASAWLCCQLHKGKKKITLRHFDIRLLLGDAAFCGLGG